jgi:hypothetical protein
VHNDRLFLKESLKRVERAASQVIRLTYRITYSAPRCTGLSLLSRAGNLTQFADCSTVPGIRQPISSSCYRRTAIYFVVRIESLVEVPTDIVFVLWNDAGKGGLNQRGDLSCREKRARFVRAPDCEQSD